MSRPAESARQRPLASPGFRRQATRSVLVQLPVWGSASLPSEPQVRFAATLPHQHPTNSRSRAPEGRWRSGIGGGGGSCGGVYLPVGVTAVDTVDVSRASRRTDGPAPLQAVNGWKEWSRRLGSGGSVSTQGSAAYGSTCSRSDERLPGHRDARAAITGASLVTSPLRHRGVQATPLAAAGQDQQ